MFRKILSDQQIKQLEKELICKRKSLEEYLNKQKPLTTYVKRANISTKFFPSTSNTESLPLEQSLLSEKLNETRNSLEEYLNKQKPLTTYANPNRHPFSFLSTSNTKSLEQSLLSEKLNETHKIRTALNTPKLVTESKPPLVRIV